MPMKTETLFSMLADAPVCKLSHRIILRALRLIIKPGSSPTLTKRLLYFRRLPARPQGFLLFSCLGTLGVWPRTLPARAREPWTLPTSNH